MRERKYENLTLLFEIFSRKKKLDFFKGSLRGSTVVGRNPPQN